MFRQNRVTPTSTLIADRARGLFMGNRGCLHNDEGRVIRHHQGRLWICCLTAFKDRKRQLMQPGRYTELFFLDEAVALAAGHRPCAECRRADYLAFRAAWSKASQPAAPRACDMDTILHRARYDPQTHSQRTHTAAAGGLPDGTFVQWNSNVALIFGVALFPYHPTGYGPPLSRPDAKTEVCVLTPAPIVAVLDAGYSAHLHGTASAQSEQACRKRTRAAPFTL